MASAEREMLPVKVKLLRGGAVLPKRQSEGAAGFDLCARLDAAVSLEPFDRAAVPTGIALEIPRGYEGQVRPRSGLAKNAGVTVLNAPGTIDSDYRGELAVLLVNWGKKAVVINNGDRIAQIVFAPVVDAVLKAADELSATAREAKGFGSTGL
jgi:dUTP pyrophosphatase